MVDTRSWDRGDWRKYYDGVLQKKPVDGTVRSRDSTTMQIVCVGLGRTGSTSLALALQVLGYTVLHDDEQTDVYACPSSTSNSFLVNARICWGVISVLVNVPAVIVLSE